MNGEMIGEMIRPASTIPTLTTRRLVLRGARRADFEPFADMMAHPRTQYMGGPYDRDGSWGQFCIGIANWTLYGYGAWIITDRQTDAFVGEMGILHPATFPEPEIGWSIAETAEGQGYATEAAQAVLNWWWDVSDSDTLVSYIDLNNGRSQALATRLGAVPDDSAPLPVGDTRADMQVYRHTRPGVTA